MITEIEELWELHAMWQVIWGRNVALVATHPHVHLKILRRTQSDIASSRQVMANGVFDNQHFCRYMTLLTDFMGHCGSSVIEGSCSAKQARARLDSRACDSIAYLVGG